MKMQIKMMGTTNIQTRILKIISMGYTSLGSALASGVIFVLQSNKPMYFLDDRRNEQDYNFCRGCTS